MRKLCKHCRNPFDPKRRDQQYCKPTCKQYAYLQRNGMELAGKNQGRKTVNDGNDQSMTHPETVNDEIKASMTEKPEPVNDASQDKKESMTDNSNQKNVNDSNVMEPSITLSKAVNDTNPSITLAETEKHIIPLSEQAGAGQKPSITNNPIPVSDSLNGQCELSMTGKTDEAANRADQSMTLSETVNDTESGNPSLMPVQKHPDPLPEQSDIVKQSSITDAGIAAMNKPVNDGKSENPTAMELPEKINDGNATGEPIHM